MLWTTLYWAGIGLALVIALGAGACLVFAVWAVADWMRNGSH